MKLLQEFRGLVEEEKSDYSKFDMLVRAGLANKSQLQRIHRILDKMGEEKPLFNNMDREIMRNLFNKMADLITNNKQIFQRTRQAVRESIIDTSDYKIGPSGRKIKAHRIKIGDRAYGQENDIKEDFELIEAPIDFDKDPPFVLVLKRRAIRLYPDKTKVALYYSKTLDKYFSVPYGGPTGSVVQAEEVEVIEESVDAIGQLQKIKDNNSIGTINHKDGSASKVDVQTAHAVLMIHESLNGENQKKLADMVARSSHHMKKAADFAFSKTK